MAEYQHPVSGMDPEDAMRYLMIMLVPAMHANSSASSDNFVKQCFNEKTDSILKMVLGDLPFSNFFEELVESESDLTNPESLNFLMKGSVSLQLAIDIVYYTNITLEEIKSDKEMMQGLLAISFLQENKQLPLKSADSLWESLVKDRNNYSYLLNDIGIFLYNHDLKAKSLSWFIAAGHAGNSQGDFNAGLLYQRGDGTSQNLDEAKKYFESAKRKGHLQGLAETICLVPDDSKPVPSLEPPYIDKTTDFIQNYFKRLILMIVFSNNGQLKIRQKTMEMFQKTGFEDFQAFCEEVSSDTDSMNDINTFLKDFYSIDCGLWNDLDTLLFWIMDVTSGMNEKKAHPIFTHALKRLLAYLSASISVPSNSISEDELFQRLFTDSPSLAWGYHQIYDLCMEKKLYFSATLALGRAFDHGDSNAVVSLIEMYRSGIGTAVNNDLVQRLTEKAFKWGIIKDAPPASSSLSQQKIVVLTCQLAMLTSHIDSTMMYITCGLQDKFESCVRDILGVFHKISEIVPEIDTGLSCPAYLEQLAERVPALQDTIMQLKQKDSYPVFESGLAEVFVKDIL